MLSLLPIISISVLMMLFYWHESPKGFAEKDWRDALGYALIVWGAIIAISTEVLGAVHQLNQVGVLVLWALVLVGTILLVYRKARSPILTALRSIRDGLRRLKGVNLTLVVLIVIIFSLTFLSAILSPPQEGDALAYHMGRVMHWAQNEALAPYATPDSRQIWMPPWSEFGFTQLFLLAGNDRFVNLIQWIAMAGAVLLVTRVAGLLGANTRGQLLSGLFLATIPVGISQASGALTDYALTMWVVLLIWFVMLSRESSLTRRDWLWLGLALGCGVLTKSNYVLFAIPLVLMLEWGVVRNLKRSEWFTGNLLAVAIAIAIVLPSWARNIQSFGSILGATEQVELHRNTYSWLFTIFSDSIRTVSMRLAIPLESVNILLYKSVYAVHELFGVLPSDPSITYHGKTFFVTWTWPGDDAAAVHTLLLALTILFYLFNRNSMDRKPARLLLLLTFMSYISYAVMFKWQGNARFYLAFYGAVAAPVGYMLGTWQRKWMQVGVVSLLTLTALPVLVSHQTRPLLPFSPHTVPQSILITDREELTFQENENWLASHRTVADRVAATGCTSVGLRIDSSDLEYPWWVVLAPFERDIHIEHLLIYPGLETGINPSFEPCAVICTICDEDDWEIEGLKPIEVEDGIYLFE